MTAIFPFRAASSASSVGNSLMHGAHQLAHNLTSSGVPPSLATLVSAPSGVLNCVTGAAAQLIVGAFCMAPLALVIDQPWLDPWPPLEAWAAIVALALVATAFGYVLYFRLIDRAGATNALLVTLLVPPTAILLGGLFFNERLTAGQFGGLAFIALGLALIDGRLLALLRRKATA